MREFQRRLAAELHDDAVEFAVGAFSIDDLKHILGRQRLEVEAIRVS